MTTITGSTLLEVLKKKMRQAREEADTAVERSEEAEKRYSAEVIRREEVSSLTLIILNISFNFFFFSTIYLPQIFDFAPLSSHGLHDFFSISYSWHYGDFDPTNRSISRTGEGKRSLLQIDCHFWVWDWRIQFCFLCQFFLI